MKTQKIFCDVISLKGFMKKLFCRSAAETPNRDSIAIELAEGSWERRVQIVRVQVAQNPLRE